MRHGSFDEAYTDLPLRATVYTSRGKGDQIQITTLIESTDASAKLNAATIALIGSTGTAQQASADEKQAASSPLMMSLLGAPGSYRIRAAATDATGRAAPLTCRSMRRSCRC